MRFCFHKSGYVFLNAHTVSVKMVLIWMGWWCLLLPSVTRRTWGEWMQGNYLVKIRMELLTILLPVWKCCAFSHQWKWKEKVGSLVWHQQTVLKRLQTFLLNIQSCICKCWFWITNVLCEFRHNSRQLTPNVTGIHLHKKLRYISQLFSIHWFSCDYLIICYSRLFITMQIVAKQLHRKWMFLHYI